MDCKRMRIQVAMWAKLIKVVLNQSVCPRHVSWGKILFMVAAVVLAAIAISSLLISNTTALGLSSLFEREAEYPDEYTVGTTIWRSNASGLKVHGQFGCASSYGWSAKSGCVKYNAGILLPQVDHVCLQLRFSKDSASSVPINVYLDDELSASVYPQNQGSWDRFAWTDEIDLGGVEAGIHSLRFCTDGQTYGVADLDTFTLAACNVHDLMITKTATPSTLSHTGDPITYVLSYRNVGAFTATGVLITDFMPFEVSDVSFDSSHPVTPTGSISYSWLLGNLTPGQSGVITVTGTVSTELALGSVFTNTTTITATTPDAVPENNKSWVPVMISFPVYVPLVIAY